MIDGAVSSHSLIVILWWGDVYVTWRVGNYVKLPTLSYGAQGKLYNSK